MPGQHTHVATATLLLVALVWGLSYFALTRTSVSNTGFITGLYVTFTPLLIRCWWRERVPAPAWLGAASATPGLALLAGVGASPNAGDGLVLLSALALAVYILQTDRAVKQHAAAPSASQLLVCAAICLVAAPCIQQLAVLTGASVWTAIAVTALLATAFGISGQVWAQQRVPPARAAVILSCEPAFGGLFGVALEGDPPVARRLDQSRADRPCPSPFQGMPLARERLRRRRRAGRGERPGGLLDTAGESCS
jgi:drug/metabolite transporter (DMT)-like permease